MWKRIEGYRYPYRINEEAEVQRRLEDGTWRTLKGSMQCTGGSGVVHRVVKLAVWPGGHRRVEVVRLMEGRFFPRRGPGEVISYRNRCAGDCAARNLYLTTPGALAKALRPNRRSVEKIDEQGRVLELYRSMREAAKHNYMSVNAVSRRCLGKVKHPFRSTGFSFRYEERKR